MELEEIVIIFCNFNNNVCLFIFLILIFKFFGKCFVGCLLRKIFFNVCNFFYNFCCKLVNCFVFDFIFVNVIFIVLLKLII